MLLSATARWPAFSAGPPDGRQPVPVRQAAPGRRAPCLPAAGVPRRANRVQRFFADGNIVHESAAVEIGCCRQRLAACPRESASSKRPTSHATAAALSEHDLAIALQRVLPEQSCAAGTALAAGSAWPGHRNGSPTAGPTASRAVAARGAVQARIGQQAGQLLVGKVDGALRPRSWTRPEQRKAEFGGGRQQLVPMGRTQDRAGRKPGSLPGTEFCIFHGAPGKINAPVTPF